jgi:Fic family protein
MAIKKTDGVTMNLKIVAPAFGSHLTNLIMELDYLRKKQLGGSTHPAIFFQLKEIFHILESVGSARIEGNRTTVAEYVESQLHADTVTDEIQNIEKALDYIEEHITEAAIDHRFICDLHALVVKNLSTRGGGEGDKTPGQYRNVDVAITQSEHKPPSHLHVREYMDELVEFINKEDLPQFDLLKIAIAHHRFVWIHPFANGNGRTVRLLTYAMLAKAGFRVHEGRLINPGAVFFADRERYSSMLSATDKGTDEAILAWCEYVLQGLRDEIEKIDLLTDHAYLKNNILKPSFRCALDRGNITENECRVLVKASEVLLLKNADVKEATGIKNTSQVSQLIKKMRDQSMLMPEEEGARRYVLQFKNKALFRCVLKVLTDQGFVTDSTEE